MLNKLISKIGLDKITHFLAGGFIFSILYIFITNVYNYTNIEKAIIISFLNILVFAISIIREVTGKKIDWYDIIATILGSFTITIITLITL